VSALTTSQPYSRIEELAHALTAGLGIIACSIALPWLAWVSFGDLARLVAGLVFGASALAMFVTSVIYHWERDPGRKVTFRKLDHAAIYLLIAGTYTPVALLALRGVSGWLLFAAVWTLAVLGIVAKTTLGFRFPRLSTLLYLAMGWICILVIRPLSTNLTPAELAWLIGGGLVYTAGVPFYVWKSRRFTHAIWHLFVLGGVACHFAAVISLVDRARSAAP
jgi:hemolysin III